MYPPCYDRATKTDCPKRTETCKLNCPKWAKYLEERDKEYERRRIEAPVRGAFTEMATKNWSKKQRYRIHTRSTTRGGNSRDY